MERDTWKHIKSKKGLSGAAEEGYREAASAYQFGRAVREARIARGLDQGKLAVLMRTSQSAVARLEAGGVAPNLRTILRVSEVLGLKVGFSPDRIWTELVTEPSGRQGRPAKKHGAVREYVVVEAKRESGWSPAKRGASRQVEGVAVGVGRSAIPS